MENKFRSFPNKIQISQFGALFLKQLPQQVACKNIAHDEQKLNESIHKAKIKRRGKGINFQQFATHTQAIIHNEVNTLLRVKTQVSEVEVTQTKRKQILHHNNWMNEQKMIKHKLSDTQSRMEQAKFSEYDWKKQRQSLLKTKIDILDGWEATYLTRQKRIKSKLKNLMQKKYTKRSESGLICLSITKKCK